MDEGESDKLQPGDVMVCPITSSSPKLNGHMEQAQRTHTEEFYDLYMGELDLKSVNRALLDWSTQ